MAEQGGSDSTLCPGCGGPFDLSAGYCVKGDDERRYCLNCPAVFFPRVTAPQAPPSRERAEHDAARVDVLLRLDAVRYDLEAIARKEDDCERQPALVQAATVLDDVCAALLGGHTEKLETLWKTALKSRGGASAVALPNQTDMEILFEQLETRVARTLATVSFENAVHNALLWIRERTELAPAPDGERWWPTYQAVLNDAGLRSKKQRADAGAILRACLRACGVRAQVGKRKHAREHRAKKKALVAKGARLKARK